MDLEDSIMMRKYRCFSVAFMWMVLLLGCASTLPKSSDTAVYKSKNFQIYKTEYKSYYVMQEGERIYSNLKYATPYMAGIVVLDSHNKQKFLKIKQRVVNTQDEEGPLLLCGNSENTHLLTVQRKAGHLNIMAKVVSSYNQKRQLQKNTLIVSIPLSKADKIFFVNNRLELELEGDAISSLYLYFQKGKQFGFLGKIKSTYKNGHFNYMFTKSTHRDLYDDMHSYSSGDMFLKKDALVGYYFRHENRMIPIKYKVLQSFYDNTNGILSRFELPDGRKGYVDTKGNEYYDE